ncbi:lipase [Alcanivorax hongdengensis A-11-3]|uniref:Lipase n=1 Tax=Alcanivorax hongdengensis A-11-3 TaxID=1177179 RepID=L0WIY8_9GAMM|nr:triacylglycerol lipase [Alcanivorax hongdengensis]EKF75810.1 lipase [Alcanivorax hongdengensis A-11-3]
MSIQIRGLLAALILLITTTQAQAWSLFGKDKHYADTRYPIVLVGGIIAFDDIAGVDYFYGIADDLRDYGADVYESNVSAMQGNEYRGEELITQIEEYLAVSGASKVNLIAHSQGAPTARYVAAVRPDLVASITSVHGENRGTPVADVIRGVVPAGSVTEGLADAITFAFAGLWEAASGGPNPLNQSASAVLADSTTAGMADFNRRYPQAMPAGDCGTTGQHTVNGVQYWSWGGTGVQTNYLDPFDSLLVSVTKMAFPKGMKHDGVLPLCGMYLGTPIRHDYNHNHADAIRQLFGLLGWAVDPKTLYRNQANRLKNAGL